MINRHHHHHHYANYQYSDATAFTAKATGYFPGEHGDGKLDAHDHQLHTLQQFLRGESSYVSVSMDKHILPQNTALSIPALDRAYNHGNPIQFRVVDTGGSFKHKKLARLDICTESKNIYDPALNSKLQIFRTT